MAGKKPLKPTTTKNEATSFPGLQKQHPGDAKTAYEERQADEVTVLEAIYGEDFVQHKAAHSAWKKSEPSFDIRIKAASDEDFAATLGVVLTATYPKSVPVLTLKDHDGLRESTLFKARKFLEAKAREMAAGEEEMIHPLVEGIRDILDDAALAKAQGLELPSLEEERAAHETKMAERAAAEKEQQARQRAAETLEEERTLGALVEQERERQRSKAREVRRKNRGGHGGHNGPGVSPERGFGGDAPSPMVFDEPCDLTDATGNTVYFKTVTGRMLLHTGSISRVYLVQPVLSESDQQHQGQQQDQQQWEPRGLALKQTEIRSSTKDAVQVLKQMQQLETQLKALKKLRRQKVHRNVLDVIDFKIERTSVSAGPDEAEEAEEAVEVAGDAGDEALAIRQQQQQRRQRRQPLTTPPPQATSSPQEHTTWSVSVLSLLADKGSLSDILELAGRLDVNKVRAWTRDLLDALDFLHSHSLLHEDIHPSNILLVRGASGDIVPKLADASYQRLLHDMYSREGPTMTSMRTAHSAYWLPPEIAGASRPQYTQKTDVWHFGVVFLQMVFGLDVPQKYHSPRALMDSHNLSASMIELVSKFFIPDPKKRPRAFDLGSCEFLATDAPILASDTFDASESLIPLAATAARNFPSSARLRRESTTRLTRTPAASRYREDFIEEGRLGKGGFGEVVKARKKLDGQIYAIKKITISQGPQENLTVTDLLKEVRLLSQLSHPAVVRYYNAWLEEIIDYTSSDTEASVGSYRSDATEIMGGGGDDNNINDDDIDIEFTRSGGLDFMSSGRYPNIAFESDSEEEDEDDDEDDKEDSDDEDDDNDNDDSDDDDDNDDDDNESENDRQLSDNDSTGTATNNAKKQLVFPGWRRARRGSQRPGRTIMYISMEYCEKRSLRDLIARNLSKDMEEVWRLFRQLLEGLTHIHGLGIVHRDLKPENIFIGAGPDGVNNVKIGDFGLATTGQLGADKGLPTSSLDAHEETRSIGTAVYVAPEVRSGGSGSYTSKVDMYSLGVIFFEMGYPPMVGMQRADVLTKLRGSPPVLPADFKPKDKSQVDIILSLLTHNPKDRPSGAELLKSGKLPVQMESETIRHALAELSDPNSPYYQKMLSMLFSKSVETAKDYAWDMSSMQTTTSSQDLMRQFVVKEILVSVFRRHGAVETTRSSLYPRSALYRNANLVQVLDRNGNVLQMPFDLTMGHARALARCSTSGELVGKSYTFGSIFRDRPGGGQPSMFREVDFDLVTTHTLDLALREAEVIKVIDEIATAFPTLRASPLCFQLGHSDLLQLIFDFCGVEQPARRAVADVLSRLNSYNMTWQRLRSELRSPLVGASSTSIDELQKFDFRDTPSKAFAKLKTLFEGTDTLERASSTLAHLREVYAYCKRLGVGNKIYVCPLYTWNEAFFSGGIMFSCLHDKKVKDVFAAGGRYDGLIKELRPRFGTNPPNERHAVGFSLNWEKLAQAPPRSSGKAFLKKAAEEETLGAFSVKRCDVLVASFDPTILRSTGIELLQTLWAHDISAELAGDARSTEDLISKNRDEGHSWIVIIKQEGVAKIKTMPTSGAGSGSGGAGLSSAAHKKDYAPDVEVSLSQVVNWLRGEMRERESARNGAVAKVAAAAAATAASSRDAATGSGSFGSFGSFHLQRGLLPIPSESNSGGGFGNSAGSEGRQQQDVVMLVGQTKSKKFNRQAVVEQAQLSAARLVRSFLTGPIAAVETTDQVLNLIRKTALSSPDSWRHVEQQVSTVEKRYTRELQAILEEWKTAFEAGTGSRHAFIYNFRTGTCIYYDVGA